MPRPSRPPRRLLAAALLAAAAALPACRAGQIIAECPGLPVAALTLQATRTAASCDGGTVPADGDTACAAAGVTGTRCQVDVPTPACCFDGLFPVPPPFQATIAYDQASASAAFCLPVPGAAPYTGSRTAAAGGEQLEVALDTTGAVLASCAATCAVTVHHAVSGLVTRATPGGPVTGFTGTSAETASATPAATCAPCTTPCQATWALTGTP